MKERLEAFLLKWMPGARLQEAKGPLARRFDGVVTWKTPLGPIRYLVEEKRHFQHQDARIVVERMKRQLAELPPAEQDSKLLLLALEVRPKQAVELERAGIDYVDLAGNAHLEGPGLLVHVEGRRPEKVHGRRPGRISKGWAKTILALLVQPKLVTSPYRVIAKQADVSLGTVAKSMKDLDARGLVAKGRLEMRIIDRPKLVALWVQAYLDVLRPGLEERRFQVRADSKPMLWKRLREVMRTHDRPWALTGADAAERRSHFFRAEETEIYAPVHVFDNRSLQKDLTAQPSLRSGNLIVIEPPGPSAILLPGDGDIPEAPDVLTYAELRYRGTAQALEAAELLLSSVLADG